MYISDPEQRTWIQDRIEAHEVGFTANGKKAILKKLIEAESFERFLDFKYTGTKRFGLDGGESMVPALEQIIKRGGQLGVSEIVIGMGFRASTPMPACSSPTPPHRARWLSTAPGITAPTRSISRNGSRHPIFRSRTHSSVP